MVSCYKIIDNLVKSPKTSKPRQKNILAIKKKWLKGITSGMDGILTWEESSHGKEKNVKRFGFT
jgi:hypothetical protein